ncbi:MAG: hypothetical protein HZB38_03625 [Planctomycetes bacterium]|nr:hypothetical protein [Planctomycetota bacterium]
MRKMAIIASVLAACGIGGCPSDGGSNEPVISQLEGAWQGSLACERTQTLNGGAGTPVSSSQDLTIQFDANGKPGSVTILGFSGDEEQTAALNAVGDTATLTSSSSGLAITRMVTVTSVSYTDTRSRIVLSIEYSGVGGNLSQTGTGTQTIDATLVNGAVQYNAEVNYAIQFVASGISLDTTETTICTGTLSKQ